jgi:hypothetical protein
LGRDAYKILVRKPKEIDHLEDIGVNGDNIKVDLQEAGWGSGLDLTT